MDINILASDIVSVLTPFLPYILKGVITVGKKALEKAGEEIGEEITNNVKSMWDKLPDKNGKKSAIEKSILENEQPLLKINEEMEQLIASSLKEDPVLAQEIGTIYQQIEKETVVRIFSRNRWQLPMGNIKISDQKSLKQALYQLHCIKKATPELPLGVLLLEELMNNQLAWLDMLYPAVPAPSGQPESDDQPEFYDRAKIMEKIRYENQSSRVIELTGPSGIGKTHLITALSQEEDQKQNQIPEHIWGFWRYVRVDCREQTTYDAIMGQWNKQLGNIPNMESPVQDLAFCLMELISNQAQKIHVLFFLDHVDRLSDEVLAKLVGEDGPVGDSVRKSLRGEDQFFLRLVLATRRPRLNQDFLQKYKLQYNYVQPIDPLDANTIKLMLQDRYRKVFHGGQKFQEIDVMVQSLLDFTGGHPKAVSEALNELQRRRFIGDFEILAGIFWKITQLIAKRDILGELNLQDYFLLNVLSMYRWFTVSLIIKLAGVGILPENVLPNHGSSSAEAQTRLIKVLTQLAKQTGLIQRNVNDFFYKVHPVLQPVLQKDLERKQSMTLPDLYKEAYDIYDNFLTRRDDSGRLMSTGDLRPKMTLEAIYHLAKGLNFTDDACDTIRDAAKKLIDLDRQAIQQMQDDPAINPDMLKMLWQNDFALHLLLKGPENKCLDLFNALDKLFNEQD